jgi:hypothetical protein
MTARVIKSYLNCSASAMLIGKVIFVIPCKKIPECYKQHPSTNEDILFHHFELKFL